MPQKKSTRPTQKDIAELAGVSITTVSHVVNGTRPVAPETKAAVLQAIEETGYTGDVIARSLVTGGTRSIGVAISLLANPYFAALMQAIEARLRSPGTPCCWPTRTTRSRPNRTPCARCARAASKVCW